MCVYSRLQVRYLLERLCNVRRRRAQCRSLDLSSSASPPLQCNWLWQRHTWQQWERWQGSFEHRCAVLQQRTESKEGHESPQATDLWYGSVSQPICHICPCHSRYTWWLARSYPNYLKIHRLLCISLSTCRTIQYDRTARLHVDPWDY